MLIIVNGAPDIQIFPFTLYLQGGEEIFEAFFYEDWNGDLENFSTGRIHPSNSRSTLTMIFWDSVDSWNRMYVLYEESVEFKVLVFANIPNYEKEP